MGKQKKIGRPLNEDIYTRMMRVHKAAINREEICIEDAALFIGAHPHDPPTWAIDACIQAYQRELAQSHAERSMFIVLDAMWGLLISEQLSKHNDLMWVDQQHKRTYAGNGMVPIVPAPVLETTIRQALDATNTSLTTAAVRAAWNKEIEADTSLPKQESMIGFLHLPETLRARRAFVRLHPSRYPNQANIADSGNSSI